MASTDHQDFSFPTITDTLSSSIDSPPLWRLSPVASPCHEKSPYKEAEELKECVQTRLEIKCTQRKSFSCGWDKLLKAGNRKEDEDDDEAEKMDMLWENFNEEMLRRSKSARGQSEQIPDVGCVHQTLRLSKKNGTLFSPRKTGLVVFVRVMKRLLLLHNSHKPVKNHSSHKQSKRNLS
ncbi:hypothetical protein K2173_015109 [Erythroxylum novogranatense]|uniref:Uncharacterized protein n=1 Tax=Erythroxylum novogranatense TaxID=1862640 RepID=A0AAV8T189_9ROSI|nr:hypothetical protein K2173_015109 [Erythroxylum novogranatense]